MVRAWTFLMTALSMSAFPAFSQGAVTPVAPAVPVTPAVTASALTISAPSVRQAKPGEYVTLTFQALGEGEFDFVADGGLQWVAVTPRRHARVSGATLIPVTFRVPAFTPAGASPPLVLRALRGNEVVAQAQVNVDVLEQASLELVSPEEVTAQGADRASFTLEVRNQGNKTDTVDLVITNIDPSAKLSTGQVTLPPGGASTVTVNVNVGSVSPNYAFTTYLKATSRNQPDVQVMTRTRTMFNPVEISGSEAVQSVPTLTFDVRARAEAESLWGSDGQVWRFGYSIAPSLAGQLSDFAYGEASIGGLEGKQDHWLPAGFSGSFRVRMKTWDVSVRGGPGGFSVGASRDLGRWTLSPQVSYRTFKDGRAYGAALGLSGPLLGGQVKANASTFLMRVAEQSLRADQFRLTYNRNLTPRLGLLLAAGLSGQVTEEGYRTDLSAYQQLSYVGDRFDLTQSYSVGSGGLSTLGVTAGTRAVQPFMLRGAATMQWAATGWQGSVSGLAGYITQRGLGAALSGRYSTGTLSQRPAEWELTGSLYLPTVRVAGANFSASGRYTLATDAQAQGGGLRQEALLVSGLTRGPLTTEFRVGWQRRLASGEPQEQWRLEASGSYQLGSRDKLSAAHTLERTTGMNPGTLNITRVGWEHEWNQRLSSSVGYGHSALNTVNESSTRNFVSVGAAVRDLFTPGLSVGLNYTLGLEGQGGVRTSAVKVSVGYDLTRFVKTPDRVVNLFGGRIGGDIHGTLYRDENLNGQRDPAEPGLSGVTVRVNDTTVVSGPDGQYRLHVPVGRQKLTFPAGLPATLDALTPATVDVTENSNTALDLPFAPVGALETTIYVDGNRNGLRDPDEPALPYAVVSLSGGVNRSAQADSSGQVRVSSLPGGTYRLTLDAAGLPSGYTMTTPAQTVQVQAGTRQSAAPLGAALPVKEVVSTYTASNLATLASLSANVIPAGQTTTLRVRFQNAQSVTVTAFGQTWTPTITDNRIELPIPVPPGTTPGEYPVTITAKNASSERTSTVRLIVTDKP